MNIYGNGIGSPVIMINHEDKGRVDSEKWNGLLIESDSQKPGTVIFGRMPLDVEEVMVDKENPTIIHATLSGSVIHHGATATISEAGGLMFTFTADKKQETKNEE